MDLDLIKSCAEFFTSQTTCNVIEAIGLAKFLVVVYVFMKFHLMYIDFFKIWQGLCEPQQR